MSGVVRAVVSVATHPIGFRGGEARVGPDRQQWSVRHGGGAAVTYSHRHDDRLRRLLTADVIRVGLWRE